MSMHTDCPSCGTRSRGKFCSECGSRLDGGCGKCGAINPPQARFCARCGAAAGASSAAGAPAFSARSTQRGPLVAFGLAAGALSIAALAFVISRDNKPLPATGAAAAGVLSPSGAPDISNMSPRERAARLYDRVMQYAEQGRQDSVDFFAPMALASHESLGELDLDARYDYGRIAVVSGNVTIAKAQADSILAIMPTHLLGLSLAARAAEEKSDAKGATKFWTAFKKARDIELAKKLPEYVAHASDIEQATRAANRQ